MKRWRKFLTLFLTAIGISTFCGFSNTQPKAEPTELTVAFLITGAQPTDLALVEAALNKIITPKINVKVKLMPVNFGAALQQYNLMLSSGEKLDLMLTLPTSYTTFVTQGKLQEIGDLIDKYGQGIKKALGKYYKGAAINGRIYGVRPISDLAGGGSLLIRKDIVDKYRINVSNIRTLGDVEKVLSSIKSHEPNAYPLTLSSQSYGIATTYFQNLVDNLGDGFGVLTHYGQNLKVVDLYETKEYRDVLKTLRSWYLKGYIMKDIATNKEDQHSLVMVGKAYAYFTHTKPGIETQESSQNGYPCVVSQISKPFASSFSLTIFDWTVTINCEHPDKAVQLLNLMYTDSNVENILSWGIEGRHYKKMADGTIGFPTGVNEKNSGYFLLTPWMMGNEFLTYVWTGSSPDLWKQTQQFNDSALISKAIGFTYDPSSVKRELIAVSNVYNQYCLALEDGAADIDTIYPQFIKKLKAAGIDRIIAEKQKQLNAWAALNKIK